MCIRDSGLPVAVPEAEESLERELAAGGCYRAASRHRRWLCAVEGVLLSSMMNEKKSSKQGSKSGTIASSGFSRSRFADQGLVLVLDFIILLIQCPPVPGTISQLSTYDVAPLACTV